MCSAGAHTQGCGSHHGGMPWPQQARQPNMSCRATTSCSQQLHTCCYRLQRWLEASLQPGPAAQEQACSGQAPDSCCTDRCSAHTCGLRHEAAQMHVQPQQRLVRLHCIAQRHLHRRAQGRPGMLCEGCKREPAGCAARWLQRRATELLARCGSLCAPGQQSVAAATTSPPPVCTPQPLTSHSCSPSSSSSGCLLACASSACCSTGSSSGYTWAESGPSTLTRSCSAHKTCRARQRILVGGLLVGGDAVVPQGCLSHVPCAAAMHGM